MYFVLRALYFDVGTTTFCGDDWTFGNKPKHKDLVYRHPADADAR